MNAFARAMSAADAAITRHFGSTIEVVAKAKQGHFGTQDDPDRAPMRLPCVPALLPKVSNATLGPGVGAPETKVDSESCEVWLSAETIANAPWQPREGDRFTISDYGPERRFTILETRPTEYGGLSLVGS